MDIQIKVIVKVYIMYVAGKHITKRHLFSTAVSSMWGSSVSITVIAIKKIPRSLLVRVD
jgi:hypothetical protein